MTPARTPLLLLLLLLATVAPVLAGEVAFTRAMRDGFPLPGRVASPDGTKVSRVLVLIHGSGAHGMDADLTEITKDRQKNLVFKDLSDVLVAQGFAVLRYDKRAWQCKLAIEKDPAFKDSKVFKEYAQDALEYFVEDAREMVDEAARRFPGAAVYLLGHSEGAYVGLQLMQRHEPVRGIALVGFAATGLESLVLEQCVYRPLGLFQDLDGDRDGSLGVRELEAPGPLAASLKAQMAVVDLDGDGSISRLEFQAGNWSNMLMKPLIDSSALRFEARSPRVADILQKTERVVCFLQGLWDNQTPAYHAKAVELVNRHVWKKPNLHFRYLPRHGHNLDLRDREDDIVYRPISPEARTAIAEELVRHFVP